MNMLKKIFAFLTRNWKWKLLSLALAALAWIVFMNIQDPVVTETISNVKVTVENYEEYIANGNTIELSEMSLDIENLTVDVRVKARQSVMDDLLDDYEDAIYVWIDPYELEDGDDRLSIHYEIVSSYSYKYRNVTFSTLYNQSYYTVNTDSSEEVTVPLTYTLVGTPADGYGYLEDDEDIILSPSEIVLTGLSAELAEFASASITVNVSGLKDNTAVLESISFYDADGNLIYLPDSVTASATSAVLYVPIYQIKEVELEIEVTGEAADGYVWLEDLTLSSDTVKICGQESDVEAVTGITLPTLDLDGAAETVSKTYSIQDILDATYLDGEILMYDGEESVTVTCTIEALDTMDLSFGTSEIEVTGLDDDYDLSYDESTVTVTVVGTEEALENFESSDVTLSMDASDLTTASTSGTVIVTIDSDEVSAEDDEIEVSLSISDGS